MSHVDYLETDAVATVRMRRPKRHNAMTAEMARDVADALQRAADDEAVRSTMEAVAPGYR